MPDLSQRFWAGKPRLLRLLADLEASASCQRTIYLLPYSRESPRGRAPAAVPGVLDTAAAGVLEHVRESETGLAVFVGGQRTVAVVPPFPLAAQLAADGLDTAPLVQLLGGELLLGVVLLRLGRYAVAVLRGDRLAASKVGSRYVKSRHRAGGSSQRRFERSRERLVRELFDEACEVVEAVFSPYQAGLDYVLTGGERLTLRAFVGRCRYLQQLAPRTLKRALQVDRPGQAALDAIAFEAWKSEVLVFERAEESS